VTDAGAKFLPRAALQHLLALIEASGFDCIGPQVRDGAIVYERMRSAADLPEGVRASQQPGEYRLEQAGDRRLFAWANGPQALKPLLFAPEEPLWRARRTEQGFAVEACVPQTAPLAVIGVRACDLAALAIQDKIFLQGPYPDPCYAARRESLFLVAVNCTHPAATCFCASTGDGPRAAHGFDIALTELDDGFVAVAGSPHGERMLDELALPAATRQQVASDLSAVEQAAAEQTRSLPGRNLRDALFANLQHPRWDEVAARCLSCGNCTMVCPTCFCHAESDVPALDGTSSVHQRQWDSCFTAGHAYIHGMQLRPQTSHRYRQWLTHKLGSWHDQFGSSGCVGCGRCIAWCPVGIDITEEAGAICGGGDA
jgi:sulfhydrogenase subunit beta (sulfur reductase)